MPKLSSTQSKHISNLLKTGKPRRQKKRRGNAVGKTSRSGSGKKLR